MTKIFNKKETFVTRKILRKNQTKYEKIMWSYLRNRQFLGLKFYRQYGIGFYIADFYCPEKKLVIELDGPQHSYKNNRMNDKVRDKQMNILNIKVLRFKNSEIENDIKSVLSKIKKVCENI